jgi:NAD(P)H dehydrogenase (quinone)
VAVHAADFEDPVSLARAFVGAQRLLLISTDALDRPSRRLEQHQAAPAAGQGKAASIARDDLARAAATAPAGSTQGKDTHTLSAAEALTTAEITAQLSGVLGRPIAAIPVSTPGLVQGLVGARFPQPLAQVFASFDTKTAAGFVGTVPDDYRRITASSRSAWATGWRPARRLSGR